jgi:hypothetical protein
MSSTITYPFVTPGNYTLSDSNKIEVSGGYLQLRDQREVFGDGNATIHDSYINGSSSANWGDGTLTRTLTGATIPFDKLDCRGGTIKYASYSAVANADSQQTGTIRFTYIPGYSGAPAANRGLFSIIYTVANAKNAMQFFHSSSGGLALGIWDSAGVQQINQVMETWTSNVSATPYEYELNYDFTTGATRLFRDGVQVGPTLTQTFTRDGDIDELLIGTSRTKGTSADAQFDDVVVFSTVQHTGNYTPGATIPQTIYVTDNPTALFNATIKSSELLSFTQSPVAGASNITKYTIIQDGVEKYYSGGWTTSNGTYAQANTAAEINTNAESLQSNRETIQFKAHMHSDDGSARIQLDLVTVTYDSALADPSFPSVTNAPSELEGFVYSPDGVLANEDVQIRPYLHGFVNDDVFHPYIWKVVATTNSVGWFETDIYIQPTGEYWELKIGPQSYKIELEDIPTNNLKDVVVEVVEN